jgi:hypothetical protein
MTTKIPQIPPAKKHGKMTQAQALTAFRLACLYLHGWATHTSGGFETDDLARGGDCDALHLREKATCPTWVGISPAVHADGCVWHETCSGRTTWRVTPDGTATVWLSDHVWIGDKRQTVWQQTIRITPDGVGIVVDCAPGQESRHLDTAICQLVTVPMVLPERRPPDDGAPVRRL